MILNKLWLSSNTYLILVSNKVLIIFIVIYFQVDIAIAMSYKFLSYSRLKLIFIFYITGKHILLTK